MTFEEISIGDFAEIRNTIAEGDILTYARLTGDNNPAHLDENYAAGTIFKKRIAHGMLIASLISTVLGNKLPGHGTIYISQTIRFLTPVYIGDAITARVEVLEKHPEKKRLILKTTCTNQDGLNVIEGKAEVSPPRTLAVR